MTIYEWARNQTTPVDVYEPSTGFTYGTYDYILNHLRGEASRRSSIAVYDEDGIRVGYATPIEIDEDELELCAGRSKFALEFSTL